MAIVGVSGNLYRRTHSL